MKINIFSLLILLMLGIILSGCGNSNEKINTLSSLQAELSTLQMQYYPVLSELGRVASQLDGIVGSQKLATSPDLQVSKGLIADAFGACDGWQIPPQDDYEGVIRVMKFDIGLLKEAIGKGKSAIKKAHEVIEANAKIESQKKR